MCVVLSWHLTVRYLDLRPLRFALELLLTVSVWIERHSICSWNGMWCFCVRRIIIFLQIFYSNRKHLNISQWQNAITFSWCLNQIPLRIALCIQSHLTYLALILFSVVTKQKHFYFKIMAVYNIYFLWSDSIMIENKFDCFLLTSKWKNNKWKCSKCECMMQIEVPVANKKVFFLEYNQSPDAPQHRGANFKWRQRPKNGAQCEK